MRRILIALLLGFAPQLLSAVAPGLPVGPEIQVNAGAQASALNPQVAVFADGGFVVVWTAGLVRTVLHARFFDAQGVAASGEFLLVRQPGSEAVDAVAADADGTFLVVWEHTSHTRRVSVFAQRFNRDGSAAGAPLLVHAINPLDRFGGLLAVDPRGGFAVAWTADAGSHLDTYARRFSAADEPLGQEFAVYYGNDSGEGADAIAAGIGIGPDGALSVGVELHGDGAETLLLRFDVPAPAPDGAPLEVGQDRAVGASLSVASDGTFVVIWSTFAIDDGVPSFPFSSVVSARRFAGDGTPLEGASFQVNRRGGFETFPRLVALPGGAFVTVWTDRRGRDGDGDGVFGRFFAPDGTPQTGDFHVNSTTAGDQVATAAAVGAGGQIVVVWQSSLGPGFIVARRLNPAQ